MTRLCLGLRGVVAGFAAAFAFATPVIAQEQPGPDLESSTEAAPMTKGEKQLAKLLEGREAGEPVRCIRTLPSKRIQTIDKTAYVFGSGTTIYVQRTRNPEQIDRRYALVTQRFNATDLCRLDVVTAIDPITGIFAGVVFFEDFIPYTVVRERKAKRD
ncbi:hypothetical protein [Erythrobacter dokdonensis]|uniref:Uncharacterized protein n=1 Tax=Erythrobacter dokdonensis DSW-74 TaxID=1300349 RepID=A0A1A7BIH3_9SPHN|nr:hypothetical protein [Erythrobacter dokdonensis]OBV11005.1 hypothetical protein I603_1413 [Erythrobacter dokdonensis DSW-74]